MWNRERNRTRNKSHATSAQVHMLYVYESHEKLNVQLLDGI